MGNQTLKASKQQLSASPSGGHFQLDSHNRVFKINLQSQPGGQRDKLETVNCIIMGNGAV